MIIDNIMVMFLLFCLGYAIGFFVGSIKEKADGDPRFLPIMEPVAKMIHNLTTDELPTGMIKPKTARQLYEKHLPEKIRESKQAMKDLLDSDPDMQRHKQLLEKYKKKGVL